MFAPALGRGAFTGPHASLRILNDKRRLKARLETVPAVRAAQCGCGGSAAAEPPLRRRFHPGPHKRRHRPRAAPALPAPPRPLLDRGGSGRASGGKRRRKRGGGGGGREEEEEGEEGNLEARYGGIEQLPLRLPVPLSGRDFPWGEGAGLTAEERPVSRDAVM